MRKKTQRMIDKQGRNPEPKTKKQDIHPPAQRETTRRQAGPACKECGGRMLATTSEVIGKNYPSFISQHGNRNVIQRLRRYKCDECGRTVKTVVEIPGSL